MEVLLFINLLFARSHFTESQRRHRDPQELEERGQRLAAYGTADSSWKPEEEGACVHRMAVCLGFGVIRDQHDCGVRFLRHVSILGGKR